jgi:crotonobetainyl-CoA:carnitine CoA-transferase CaiB-like acyl-CoA transferase
MQPLSGYHVLLVAVNIPGPVAAARLAALGAMVIKIEPPGGDPLAGAAPEWYASLHARIDVVPLDLKTDAGQARVHELLEASDLLLTSYRPSSLERIGLASAQLEARYPRLSQVVIVGEESPHENRPGHDLTYQAQLGLVAPPALPRALVADLAGAQEAVTASLALLLSRQRGGRGMCATVSLREAATQFAEPLKHGLTAAAGILGGGFAGYNLYRTRDGWVALAAIEPGFVDTLCREWQLADLTFDAVANKLRTRTSAEWERWAIEHDVPLVAVRGVESQKSEEGGSTVADVILNPDSSPQSTIRNLQSEIETSAA